MPIGESVFKKSERTAELRANIRHLRIVFTLVPWRMRFRIVLMCLAAFLSSILDLVAVAAMLPLTQMLTNSGELPETIETYLVPIVGTDDRQTLLIVIALAVGVAFFVKNVAIIGIRWWSIGETKRAAAAVQGELLRRYSQSSYVDHRQRSKSSMLNMLVGAVPAAFDSVLGGYIALVVDAITVLMMFSLLVLMSPQAAIAAMVVFGGFAFLIARVIKPYSLKYAHRSFVLERESLGVANPAIEGFRETKIFQRENLFTDAYAENRTEAAGLQRFQQVMAELPKYLLEVVMIFGILVVAVLLFVTQDQSTAFGLLAVFAAAAMRIIPALNRIVASLNMTRSGTPSLTLLAQEIHQLESERLQTRASSEQILEIPWAPIRIESVGFRYPDSNSNVLSDVDVTIQPGTTVALVGSSGAGKTTFADILAGLFDPTEGAVTVGGIDISEHPKSWLRTTAVVSQKVYLWDASLRDLITFGQPRESVDEELLREVIRKARLETVIESMPKGIETTVGDAGARLSGGQTQRLGIARALYSKPKVLILDEATSALDNETEHEITATIDELHGQVTVIVVAHRLSTIKNADEILFFSGGYLKSRGTMAYLTAHEPEFANLVKLGQLDIN